MTELADLTLVEAADAGRELSDALDLGQPVEPCRDVGHEHRGTWYVWAQLVWHVARSVSLA